MFFTIQFHAEKVKMFKLWTLTFELSRISFTLLTGLPDQSINFADFDVVQFLDSRFNLVLVGLQVADKNQSIVIFDLLHSGLSRQWMLDDIVSIWKMEKQMIPILRTLVLPSKLRFESLKKSPFKFWLYLCMPCPSIGPNHFGWVLIVLDG